MILLHVAVLTKRVWPFLVVSLMCGRSDQNSVAVLVVVVLCGRFDSQKFCGRFRVLPFWPGSPQNINLSRFILWFWFVHHPLNLLPLMTWSVMFLGKKGCVLRSKIIRYEPEWILSFTNHRHYSGRFDIKMKCPRYVEQRNVYIWVAVSVLSDNTCVIRTISANSIR